MKPAVASDDVSRFRELIRSRTGMLFPEKRNPYLARGIRRATKEAGLPSASALYDLMARSPGVSETFDALISALNVSETHFFRDTAQIGELRTSILPELIARRRGQRTLRLWSAGCSTGEEPYTLAILLRQLVPDLSDWNLLILATDINGAAIERARRGIYREWSFRGMPASMLGRHVLRRGDLLEVAPTIRDLVTFTRLNLAEPVYPSVATNTQGMDLILCRNVLLYFDPARAGDVIGRMWNALADDGYLMVSRVDATLPVLERLRPDRPGTGVFSKAPRSEPDVLVVPQPHPASPRRPSRSRRVRPQTKHRLPSAQPVPTIEPGPVETIPSRAGGAYQAVLDAWRTAGVGRARPLLEQEVGEHPLDAPLRYLQGLLLLEERDLAGALRAFRRSTYADPAFAPGYLGQGTAFARAGHRERARVALETAARLVVDVDPVDVRFTPDGLTAAEILELVASERALLDSAVTLERTHG